MKAFLLAAGYGTRLRPLTDRVPKCLIPIRGKPMLQIWLEKCSQFGIDEVLLNIHAHAAMVREFIQTKNSGIVVRIVEEQDLLGSAGTLAANRDWVKGEDVFWVFYADVLHCVDLSAMLRLQQDRKPAATLGVYKVPDPKRCRIVEVEKDGTIRNFVEKPSDPIGDQAFAGILIGTQTMLALIPDVRPADLGFHVLPQLAGRMMAYPISEYLIDIGTMENYQSAQQECPCL